MRTLIACLAVSLLSTPVLAQSVPDPPAFMYRGAVKSRAATSEKVIAAYKSCENGKAEEIESCMRRILGMPVAAVAGGEINCVEEQVVIVMPPSEARPNVPWLSRTAETAPIVMGTGTELCILVRRSN